MAKTSANGGKAITDFFKPTTPTAVVKCSDQKNDQTSSDVVDKIERNKAEAILKLNQRLLFQLENDTVCETWREAVFKEEMEKQYFVGIKTFLRREQERHKVFPPDHLIYSWTRLCPFDQVKVVIIGQDPYHNDGQAMGLSFSVPAQFKPLPPSLQNIYKELHDDIAGFTIPTHGDLTSWARQGVLLLNATLTVRAHEPMSHGKCGWTALTDAVIKKLLQRPDRPTVFILWGGHAQKRFPDHMTRPDMHLVLRGVHPSPLSASRGFFGCKHFSTCNAFLAGKGVEAIDWTSVCRL